MGEVRLTLNAFSDANRSVEFLHDSIDITFANVDLIGYAVDGLWFRNSILDMFFIMHNNFLTFGNRTGQPPILD